ncbi:MAG: hypothetical protein PVG39_02320 [Desulfobacteraceae bacterium]|jgi:hypothetical protein
MQIVPDKKDLKKPAAEFITTITWDLYNSSDVDVWVKDPAGNLISFKNKERGLTHIDRDDLGNLKDTFTLPDGRKVTYKYNQEIVTIRGFIPGEWIFNLHLYNKRSSQPVRVHFRMDKINPTVTTVLSKEILLKRHWEEKTVVRFTMSNDGKLIHMHDLPISLVKESPFMRGPATIPHRQAGEI